MKDFYKEIDNALKSYEDFEPCHDKGIDWICHRIGWCWRWKKISKNQMEELTTRAMKILNETADTSS